VRPPSGDRDGGGVGVGGVGGETAMSCRLVMTIREMVRSLAVGCQPSRGEFGWTACRSMVDESRPTRMGRDALLANNSRFRGT
jgi:hypothetical protein